MNAFHVAEDLAHRGFQVGAIAKVADIIAIGPGGVDIDEPAALQAPVARSPVEPSFDVADACTSTSTAPLPRRRTPAAGSPAVP